MPGNIYINKNIESRIDEALELDSLSAFVRVLLTDIKEKVKTPIIIVQSADMLDLYRAAFRGCIDVDEYDNEDDLAVAAEEFSDEDYILFLENNGEAIIDRAINKFERGWDWEIHLEYILEDWVKDYWKGKTLKDDVK
jgi:hypothetical protein